MLEDVTQGDEYREAEEDEGLDAVPMLLLKGGSCGGLGLRKLRLMRAPLSGFLLTLQLSSTARTLVGHNSTPLWMSQRAVGARESQDYDDT